MGSSLSNHDQNSDSRMVIGVVVVVALVALVVILLLSNQTQQPVTPADADANSEVMVTIESPVEPTSADGAAVDVPPAADDEMDMIEATAAMDDEMVATPAS